MKPGCSASSHDYRIAETFFILPLISQHDQPAAETQHCAEYE